jgi:isopenicillin-N epimerase
MTTRRQFLRTTGLAGAASLAGLGIQPRTVSGAHAPACGPSATPVLPLPPHDPAAAARDEAYWRAVARLYRVAERPINLEAGFFGVLATPVLDAFLRNVEQVNREGSTFARREYPALEREARARVAAFVGAEPGEIAFTRNATEALQTLIGQFRHVGDGDTVMYADLDYAAMQLAMDGLAARTGANVARVVIPEPASHAALLEAYDAALRAHPRTRLLLLTHTNNKTGLIHPVREIGAIARARGVEVIVDAAHSFGQFPLTVDELGADFVGFNLHKWIGAPVGLGALFIRTGRFDAIAPAHGAEGPPDRIDGRVQIGTANFALMMTIPAALDFHETIGAERKAARLRYLRDRWAEAVRDVPGVDILTPSDPALACALTGFRLHRRGSRDAIAAVVQALHDEFGIFTVQRTGIAAGDCVRVTPAVFNMPADVDALAEAVRTLAGRG